MSGLIGIASAALAGTGAFSGVLAPPITVGDVPLVDFQVPRRLALGGEQKLAISEIPGGQYAIQALGDFPEDIEFEGIFQGPTRDNDAAQFVVMRQAGVPVPLIAMGLSLTVIIRHFTPIYETGWIAYRMTLAVIPDPPADQDQSGTGALSDSVTSDASAAQSSISDAATAVGNSAVSDGTLQNAGLSPLATAMDGAASGTATAVQGIANLGAAGAAGLDGNAATIGALGLAGTAETNLATVQGTIEGGIGTVNGLFSGGWSSALPIAAQAGPAILYATGAASSLAGTMVAAGYVARTAANLANAAPNAGALPPPATPGAVMTLP